MDLSKKELKEARKAEAINTEKEQQRQSLIKWLIISVSSFLFLAFFVFVIIQAKQAKNSQKTEIPISSSDHIRGNKDAKLTIVEFSDFQCPACAQTEPMVEKLLTDYPKDVRLVYKYFPLPGHKNSRPAAYAAQATDKQEKFWEMHDLLFKRQNEWAQSDSPIDIFKIYARSLKLDTDKFEKDINSKEVADKVDNDYNQGLNLAIDATPTFFLNGEELTIASYNDFKNAVDKKLGK